jgi:hypothetical protein
MNRVAKNIVFLFLISFIYANAKSTPVVACAYFEPYMVRDNLDYTNLLIYCEDENIKELRIVLYGLVSEGNPVILRDDGTHGDYIPNDHYFLKDSLKFNLGINYFSYCSFSSSEITYIYKDGTSETSNLDIPLNLFILNPDKIPIPNIKRAYVDSFIDNTDYVIAINNNFVVEAELTRTYYKYFEDNKDFLLIGYPKGLSGNFSGYFVTVSNNISGIGLNLFNDTRYWGSNNKLQGLIYFREGALGLFNHEILHKYAVYLDPIFHLAYSGAHWSALVANNSGFGYGPVSSGGVYQQIEKISSNNYKARSLDPNEERKFNDIELYLMGLKDQTAIKNPLESLIDPIYSGYTIENGIFYELYSASGISETKIEDIIKIQGIRNPSSLLSQKKFRAALVVSCDRSLTDVEFAFYNYLAEEYEKSFSEAGPTFEAATGGLAEMKTKIISIDGSPKLSDPVQVSKPMTNYVTFNWGKTDSATNYHFQLSSTNDFGSLMADSLVRDTVIIISLKNTQNIYYWRVKALDNFGESYWSEIKSLIITAIEPLLLDSTISIYPNPTDELLRIRFNSPTHSDITIHIVDLSGRSVFKENCKYFDQYEEKVLNLSQLRSGIYILKIKGEKINCVYKILKK